MYSLLAAVGGFMCGTDVLLLSSYFEGPCPDKFMELGRQSVFGGPELVVFNLALVVAITGWIIIRDFKDYSQRHAPEPQEEKL